MPGNMFHIHFITKLTRRSNVSSYYVEYPLAPAHQAQEVLERLEILIKEIQHLEGAKKLILMGDSAGGNLALVLSKRFSQDVPLFLLSPWLDVSMGNPQIDLKQHREVMFTRQELLTAAMSYQGTLDLINPLISPIHTDFSHQDITIFAGMSDILFFDIAKFTDMNPSVELHSYPGLPHDFMLFVPGKEQNQVLDVIIHKINESERTIE